MIKFTIHTPEGKREIFAPSKWNELTLGQLIALEGDFQNERTVLGAFAILTGLSLEITEQLTDKGIENKVFQVVKFLNDPPPWDQLPVPKVFHIRNKAYSIPGKVGDMMLGQKIMIMQNVSALEDLIKNIPACLAVIFQPVIDKGRNKGKLKYDRHRVEAVQEQLKNENGLECYAIANFFFLQLTNTMNFGKIDLKKCQKYRSKMKIVSKNWLKAAV